MAKMRPLFSRYDLYRLCEADTGGRRDDTIIRILREIMTGTPLAPILTGRRAGPYALGNRRRWASRPAGQREVA